MVDEAGLGMRDLGVVWRERGGRAVAVDSLFRCIWCAGRADGRGVKNCSADGGTVTVGS